MKVNSTERKAVVDALEAGGMKSKHAKNAELLIYEMCKTLAEGLNASLRNLYSTHSYEKVGELLFLEGSKARKFVLKDVKDVKTGWDSYVYAPIREKFSKINSELVEGIKVEKGEFPCKNKKCDSTECFFFQIQTRSGDEGMTVYVTCVKCGGMYHF